MRRIVIYLKYKHLRHFIVNSLLILFIGNFCSTRFKLKLLGKQYALNREQKMRCLYFSETCVLADRFIEVSLDFVHADYCLDQCTILESSEICKINMDYAGVPNFESLFWNLGLTK